MNRKIKFIETDNGIISIQTAVPTLNGTQQPMELIIAIEQEGKDIVFNLNKEQAKKLLKEMKRAVALITYLDK